MTHHDAPSGQPYSEPPIWERAGTLPPPSSGGNGGGGVLSVDPGKIFRIRPTGSPRWLTIARDVLLSLAALLLIVSWVYAVVAINRVGNAFEDIGNTTTPTSAPSNGGLPTCGPDLTYGCIDPGD
jgi:hypothetical protein